MINSRLLIGLFFSIKYFSLVIMVSSHPPLIPGAAFKAASAASNKANKVMFNFAESSGRI